MAYEAQENKDGTFSLKNDGIAPGSPEGRILEVLSRFSLDEQKVILGKVTDVITEKQSSNVTEGGQ